MEIALRGAVESNRTLRSIELLSRIIHSRFYRTSIERISWKRNRQEEGENLQTTSLNGRFFRQQVSRFSQFPIGLHIFGREFNIAMSFFVIIYVVRKAERFVWEIYRFFFFFLFSFFNPFIYLSIRLTTCQESIIRFYEIIFENRVFDFFFFFSLSNNWKQK